ncbi:surface carbohydrate biosynthesis protein [Candidatus Odyssella acanthamoebae]|uniref:UDP-N-acetylglucosamine 2-epimerase domain-containing protein n=1 Tax=Candidatus Odyssella acanthamoebae TaxID=91604 RepID=A0A077AY76_9PROT|nr:surface carbohydrate biosynthesis protein [Candidatus Paracaedibacter acanthamoebae]AIK96939.1 hypothetical protein ID47_09695 [Candidatus Paracaedibacter acanthamoebae]
MTIIKKPLFFLPVESTPRELDYKLNIARKLCRHGIDVIIGNPPFIRDELHYKNFKGGFLEKGMNPLPSYYKSLKEKNIIVYCLSDEGAAHPAFSVTYEPAVESLKLAEKVFLWGEFQRKDLIARNSNPDLISRYQVIGYPGLELSLPKYKDYHNCLRPPSIGKDYILINTNFGSINGHSMEEVLKACPSMSPETLAMVKTSYENEKKGFALFRDWLDYIIQNFPTEHFLLRPHPVEKKENYAAYFGKYKNVTISQAGNANHIIAGAKLVIHNDCTTALQSYLAGMPVISLAKSNIDYIHAGWALAFGAQPDSKEQAVDLISHVLRLGHFNDSMKSSINQQAAEITSQMFCNLDHSTETLVETILSSMRNQFTAFAPYAVKDSRTLLQKFKAFLRKFFPLHYKVPIAGRVALSPFNKTDIHQRLKLLNKIDGIRQSYKIKKLYPNTYFIAGK